MSKYLKGLICDELKNRYAELDSALWIELVGCDGNTTNEFRRELRGKEMRLEIVKNSQFRRAVEGTALSRLGDKVDGPSALVTGGESVIDAAKIIEDWIPKIKGMKMRGAILEGEYIGDDRIDGLAKMPTKADMQAKIAGTILSPGANLASAMLAGGRNIASCVKTIIEKLEDGETITKKSA